MMKAYFHCSYCESVFNNEDDCHKHEIEEHAKGKSPKYKRHDIVKLDSTGLAYYIKELEYFSTTTNQWIYSLEDTHESVAEDELSLVCKEKDCVKLYENAIKLAEALFGDKCADGYHSCFKISVRLDGHFLFTVPISTDQVLEYMANKEKSK